jgi:hypothetical protein
MKKSLSVTTPVGVFTRNTESAYTHIVVWASPRAMRALVRSQASDPGFHPSGVGQRWVKDHGYGVTWHSSADTAAKATQAYRWDAAESTLVGGFAVQPA